MRVELGEIIEEAIDLMGGAINHCSWNQFWIRSLLSHNESIKDHPRYHAQLTCMRPDDESVAELHSNMAFDQVL